MKIRIALESDRSEIVNLYQRSQAATGIPNPDFYPSESLGDELYSRDAIERYVTTSQGKIIGHGLIEHPNPLSLSLWKNGIKEHEAELIELGGAFVDPTLIRNGIYTELLHYRLNIIRKLGAIPVSATWAQNIHVQKIFTTAGGREVARQQIQAGELRLFVFYFQ